jgi:hypothetical protein
VSVMSESTELYVEQNEPILRAICASMGVEQ